MMKKLTMLLCVAAGFAGAVLLLELTFPAGGRQRRHLCRRPRSDWPVHHLIPNGRYVHSSGWNFVNVRRGKINNMGYVAPFDYLPGSKGIVVLGDSFVEGLQNEYRDTIQGSLPRNSRWAAKPIISRNRSASRIFSTSSAEVLIGHQRILESGWY
jgi:hypothetical protein